VLRQALVFRRRVANVQKLTLASRPPVRDQAGAIPSNIMNDETLNRLLHTAPAEEVALPPSFQRSVWQAIAADVARQQSRWRWLQGMFDWLAKPLPAAAACSLALVAGAVLGLTTPVHPSTSANIAAYAHFINPVTKSSAK
jgi:hypothetical protein